VEFDEARDEVVAAKIKTALRRGAFADLGDPPVGDGEPAGRDSVRQDHRGVVKDFNGVGHGRPQAVTLR
jgi:hypothetical protein